MRAIIHVALLITLALSACHDPRPIEAFGLGDEPRTTQSGICPQAWTCDHRRWYGTESACHTFCGPICERDFRCGVGCVCP